MELDWKTVAAIWGAGLSTLLAIAKIFEARPIFTLEALKCWDTPHPFYRIRIKNVSKYPIIISKVNLAPWPRSEGAIWRVTGNNSTTKDVIGSSMCGRLDIFIRAGEENTVEFTVEPDPPKRLALIVSWKTHRGVPWPAIPKFIYRGEADMQALRAHPLSEEE